MSRAILRRSCGFASGVVTVRSRAAGGGGEVRRSGHLKHPLLRVQDSRLEGPNHARTSLWRWSTCAPHRIAASRGKKRAQVAVAHSLLVAICHVLKDGTMHHDPCRWLPPLGAVRVTLRASPTGAVRLDRLCRYRR